MNTADPMLLAVMVFVVLFAFLVMRELICWYWKINIAVELLTEIRDHLRTLTRHAAESRSDTAGMMTATDYAAKAGLSRKTVIDMLREGQLPGREVNGEWYTPGDPDKPLR